MTWYRSMQGVKQAATVLLIGGVLATSTPVSAHPLASGPWEVGESQALRGDCKIVKVGVDTSGALIGAGAAAKYGGRAGAIVAVVTLVSGLVGWDDFGCGDVLDAVSNAYKEAYTQAADEGAEPGRTTSDVHLWNGVLIQDFKDGDWGAGAILMNTDAGVPHYVGGGAWSAFTRAANDYGVWPGYPINREHDWGNVRIQDFREGAWGDGAIIGGGTAELVAGNHWEAYKRADGQERLGTPRTFVNQEQRSFQVLTIDGGYIINGDFWVQYFDGGEIWERAGIAYVFFYDTGLVERVL